ncbi:hypothetical protein GCM10017687_44110 [Streptomyces echinatus]
MTAATYSLFRGRYAATSRATWAKVQRLTLWVRWAWPPATVRRGGGRGDGEALGGGAQSLDDTGGDGHGGEGAGGGVGVRPPARCWRTGGPVPFPRGLTLYLHSIHNLVDTRNPVRGSVIHEREPWRSSQQRRSGTRPPGPIRVPDPLWQAYGRV